MESIHQCSKITSSSSWKLMPFMNEDDDALPVSPESISEWCRLRNIPIHEGRQRFMELIILACISNNRTLSSGLVFKGGNALRFVYQNPRSTIDLDFTVGPLTPSPTTMMISANCSISLVAGRNDDTMWKQNAKVLRENHLWAHALLIGWELVINFRPIDISPALKTEMYQRSFHWKSAFLIWYVKTLITRHYKL